MSPSTWMSAQFAAPEFRRASAGDFRQDFLLGATEGSGRRQWTSVTGASELAAAPASRRVRLSVTGSDAHEAPTTVTDEAALPLGMSRPRAATGAVAATAFRDIYDEAMPEVYRYVFRRCGGIRSLAEDLTQETFLAVVRTGRAEEATLPWLIGIARNKLLEHWRRERREASRLARRAALRDESSAPPPDASTVVDALALLPPVHRLAITLRYFDDLPVAEVAEVLGKSVHATESILARARAALRKHYVEPAE